MYFKITGTALVAFLGMAMFGTLNPEISFASFSIFTLFFSLSYWYPPPDKEQVDLVYYSIAIVGVVLFFWISADSRKLAILQKDRLQLADLVLKQANAELVSGCFFGAVENRPALLVA